MNLHKLIILILKILISEDGGREGDEEGSDNQENSDDNSQSSKGSKDFEFVSKD